MAHCFRTKYAQCKHGHGADIDLAGRDGYQTWLHPCAGKAIKRASGHRPGGADGGTET